jgi:hypothetical protein
MSEAGLKRPALRERDSTEYGAMTDLCAPYGLRKGQLGLVGKARTNATIDFTNATDGFFNTEFTRTPIAFAPVIL